VSNDASQDHEFVIYKTDLPADQLPTNENGDVDGGGKGMESLDANLTIPPGSATSFSGDFAAGNYVFICNLPGHYRKGMYAGFTVT
jgi:uncharacterized cupredoxin-like copper-binding protein